MLRDEVLITKVDPCAFCGGTLGTGKIGADGAPAHNLCRAYHEAGLPTPCLGLRCESCDGSGWHQYEPGRYTGCKHCGGGPGVAGSGKEPGSEADLSPAEFVQVGRVRVAVMEKEALTALRRAGECDLALQVVMDELVAPVAPHDRGTSWAVLERTRDERKVALVAAWQDVQIAAAMLVEADGYLIEVTDDMEKGAR